ncbi:YncE family protein [Streptomyces sp. NPDC048191]|uniref:YncE family protein n=1 Tax=Streptomyces sp. NPDC048191 TaxID=3155484 RepID=UPI0033FC9234
MRGWVAGLLVLSGVVVPLFSSMPAAAQAERSRAYVTNFGADTVSVVDTATDKVIGQPIRVGDAPVGVAVSPNGTRVYVANSRSNNVSVINTATNTVIATVPVGSSPAGVAVSPDNSRVYVANSDSNNVSVINTATNTVTGTPIPVGPSPKNLVVSPDNSRVYVANSGSDTVSVINTNTTVLSPIKVGRNPWDVATVTDQFGDTLLYVTNSGSNNVSVIDPAQGQTITTINVGSQPHDLAVSPDNSLIYVTNFADGTVSEFPAFGPVSPPAVFRVGHHPQGVAVSPANRHIYVANTGSNTVSVITNNPTSPALVNDVPGFTEPVGVATGIIPQQLPGPSPCRCGAQ